MPRRAGSVRRPGPPAPPPSRCAKVLYYTWRLCSVVFSHFVMISLVVAYCILGAVTFERLEAQHEREVKENISQIRQNTTRSIWQMSRDAPLFNQTHWTGEVVAMLKDFENAILLEMKVRGWDGDENREHIQWTFTGALFYSIIVITTIGYGHIAPKTQTGKVVTIFYAILGIPLMLLCLSNIGDVMASSFRFLYWRACCYVCTRPPQRVRQHPRHSVRRAARGGSRGSRRGLPRAHSDTDCRYRDSGYSSGRRPRAAARPRSQPPAVSAVSAAGSAAVSAATRDFPKISLPLQDLAAALRDLEDHQQNVAPPESRSKSMPRLGKYKFDYEIDDDTPHDYDLEERNKMFQMHDLHDVDYENYKERKAIEERERRKNEKENNYYDFRDRSYDPEDDEYEFDCPSIRRTWKDQWMDRGQSEYYERDPEDHSREGRRSRRARSAVYDYERHWEEREYRRRDDIEAGRRRPLRRLETIDDSPRFPARYSPSPERDEWSDEPPPRRARPAAAAAAWGSRQSDIYSIAAETKEEIKPVPIWLCVCLVASYIVAGTFLFKKWEGWAYLDAAYFCFITLTTIGFGDFVPAQGQAQALAGEREAAAAVHSIALCSLYLLFGIALLAMSFNLVQEEVRANVAALATRLGIIKPRHQSDSDSDY